MPARKAVTTSAVTGGQAQYVLTRLIQDRRISAKDVDRYAGEMQREIAALEERLRTLREAAAAAGGEGGRRARRGPARRAGEESSNGTARGGLRRKRRRKLNLTPQRRAALKLQGQYLALIRQVPERQRSQYKRLREAKGAEAALKALRQATKK